MRMLRVAYICPMLRLDVSLCRDFVKILRISKSR